MKSNIIHSPNELLKFIELYNKGISYNTLKESHGLLLSKNTFRIYYKKYLLHGLDGLQQKSTTNSYSSDFKKNVVQEYLNGSIGKEALAIKYNLPTVSTVARWILKYTEGKENTAYSPRPEVYTMKGRKTTFEERLEIVQYVIDSGLSYKDAAEKFKVNYNNVYQWVHKYKAYGSPALKDSRGKKKNSAAEHTDSRLRAENEALKAQNQYLKMELDILKKEEEIERELMSQRSPKKRRTKPSKR